MLAEAQAAIELEGLRVRLNNFQMQGADAVSRCGILDKGDCGASPASAAIFFAEVELVDEGVPT
jgi:hypothetical protein